MADFPNKLKALRIQNGLTQQELANSLNVSQNAIYNWENGKREPNMSMQKKIAEIFDIALYILIDDDCEIPDTTSNARKNRARFSTVKDGKLTKDTELEKRPVFTAPLNQPNNDKAIKLHTNSRGIDWEQLDDFRFDELMQKLDRGETLTPEEINFKSAYLERSLKKIGDVFAKFYSMLNMEGQKKADEQIDRAIEQIILLTKIPEYQKKPDEPPQSPQE